MPKNLVIVESPAKARTIERYLGSDYQVLASYGHVRDLPENPGKGKFGVDVDHDFAPEYVISEDRKKQVRDIEKAAKGADAGLPRHRPRPRGRGDRVARRGGGARPGRQDPPGDVQRDHRGCDPRRVRRAARHRPAPRRRPADAADRRPPRGLHAQPPDLAQGPRRAVGRPRPVGCRAHGRGAGARDPRLHRPRVLDPRGDPRHGRGRGLHRGRRADRRQGRGHRRRRDRRGPRDRAARPEARRRLAHDAPVEAQPVAAVHDQHAPAGGEPQARLQPQAHDAGRPGPLRGRRHARRPRRPDHLHADRLGRDRRRGEGRGPGGDRLAVRQGVRRRRWTRVQDEAEGRPGGPRVDPADLVRPRPGDACARSSSPTSTACTA